MTVLRGRVERAPEVGPWPLLAAPAGETAEDVGVVVGVAASPEGGTARLLSGLENQAQRSHSGRTNVVPEGAAEEGELARQEVSLLLPTVICCPPWE